MPNLSKLSDRALSFLLFVPLLSIVGCDQRTLIDYGTVDASMDPGGMSGGGGMGGMFDPGFPEVGPIERDSSLGDVPVCTGNCNGDAGPTCGNGVVEDKEECDDNNPVPGDGCSGLCRVEPNFACPTAGQMCVTTVVCGDKKITGGEACDDGNTASGDGCSMTCTVEKDFACETAGQPCKPVVTERCGDGVVNQGETCDDGNQISFDGCSATCQREGGFTCAMSGKPCVKDEVCGDGKLDSNEQCDDKNTNPGDGCTGTCKLEPFFACPTPGSACVTTIVCGDSKVVADEACDDGNKVAGDGCSADCKGVEPGFTCPTAQGVGGMCLAVAVPKCGDGRLTYGEFCDDGNSTPGDGCGATCLVEPGYTCDVAGAACKLVEKCGDGKLSISNGEQCDDGKTVSGDGCSSTCIIEANYVCPDPGMPCVSTVKCGDGRVTGAETCDDGNAVGGDGCSAACILESGYVCPQGSTCRAAACGDKIIAGAEVCDDGNKVPGDGCSAVCALEPPDASGSGWVCPMVGKPCVRTTCGNNMKEGSEACDDGNNVVGDGCTPYCQIEPTCPVAGGACTSTCGDGLILASDNEKCDDGNNRNGDGCSSTCQIEKGYACQSMAGVLPDTLEIPILFRDMVSFPINGSSRHEDFEGPISGDDATLNLVQPTLGVDGKPIYNNRCDNMSTMDCPYGRQMTTKANFDQWYRDTASINVPVLQKLSLTKQPDGSYFFPVTNGAKDPGKQLFPLDGQGWVAQNKEGTSANHDFGFTSEFRWWFTFDGGESLTFSGDDDVWVFINRKLILDLGGLHPRRERTVVLDAAKATQLGLVAGNIYEFVLFHAERHTGESNFNLTLKGFVSAKSTCSSVCGDGTVTPDEACDLGTAKNTGAYGTCNANCTFPARCGDAIVNGNEQCDNGLNSSTYGGASKACAPGCMFAPYCGDSKVDGANGEACDEGATNGSGYNHCGATCQLGPRCGDKVISGTEQCDDGAGVNGTSASACMATCALKCGNAVLDAGEQCDDGAAKNTGAYGGCQSSCKLAPRCGDGFKNGPEVCDDGKNDGSYGLCAPGCVLGPRCGDMVVQDTAGEVCDKGSANMSMAYGANICSVVCKPAPFCGDKAVDAAFGEVCDDGVNSGMPGSCKVDCSAYVPLPSCGDGIVQPPEKCDTGANNGMQTSICDARCRLRCGNGIKEVGEQCDDGVNSGAYGTCNANCTLAGYCGDGVKAGPEECDLGVSNEKTPYGPNKCSTSCTIAPFCGDGRVSAGFGETCDGGQLCAANCRERIIL